MKNWNVTTNKKNPGQDLITLSDRLWILEKITELVLSLRVENARTDLWKKTREELTNLRSELIGILIGKLKGLEPKKLQLREAWHLHQRLLGILEDYRFSKKDPDLRTVKGAVDELEKEIMQRCKEALTQNEETQKRAHWYVHALWFCHLNPTVPSKNRTAAKRLKESFSQVKEYVSSDAPSGI